MASDKPRIRVPAWTRPMTAEIVLLNVVTSLDIAPERVLMSALEADLREIVICARDKHGEEYFASSVADGGDALWLLMRCQRLLLKVVDDMEPRRKLTQPGVVLPFPKE